MGGDKKNGDSKDHSILNKEGIDKLASVLERTTVERQVQRVESIEQFLDKFKDVVAQLTGPAPGRQIFVFIDDLDRCLPESALEIFEAIKLFLDAPGCSYMVAVDRDVIRKGLEVRYGNSGAGPNFIDADQYIEKAITLSFDLPRLAPADAATLIKSMQLPIPIQLSDAYIDLIVAGVGVNPRRVKRFMNSLAVQLELARLASASGAQLYDWVTDAADVARLRFAIFLKFCLIAYRSSTLLSAALDDPRVLMRLQHASNAYQTTRAADESKARTEREQALQGELTSIRTIHNDESFWRLMAAGPNLDNQGPALAVVTTWFRARPAARAAIPTPSGPA